MVGNPRKFFKKKFFPLKSNTSSICDNGGSNFKNGKSSYKIVKGKGYKVYQKEEEKKEKKLLED